MSTSNKTDNTEKKHLSELTQRVLTGLVGGIAILAAVYYNAWSYFAVFFIICMMTITEFYKLLGVHGNTPLKTYGTFVGLLLYTLMFFAESGMMELKYLFLIPVCFSTIFMIKLYKKDEKRPFRNIAYTFLGIIYVALPFSLLHSIVFFNESYNYQVLLGCILILWASDSGAYFAGKTFGKNKLFERISPKKTWEGSIGGMILSATVALVFAHYTQSLDYIHWIVIAIIMVVTGTYGDLVESLLKRSYHIKDSGTALPGHGGFLDRFDGLLLAAAFIAAYLQLFPPVN